MSSRITAFGGAALPKRRLRPFRADERESAVDLHGADLRNADLRGLDLTGADLRGADLRSARTGMSRGWSALVFALSLLLSIGVGVASGKFGAALQDLIVSKTPLARFIGVFVAAELVVLLIAADVRGVRAAALWLLPPLGALVVAGTVVAVTTGGTGGGGIALLLLSTVFVVLLALGSLARIMGGAANSLLLFAVVAVSGAIAGRHVGGGITAMALAISAMIMGRRTLEDPSLAPLLSRVSALVACRGGTSFRDADLRGARLDSADLASTDLRGARLDASALDGARLRLCLLDAPLAPASRSSS